MPVRRFHPVLRLAGLAVLALAGVAGPPVAAQQVAPAEVDREEAQPNRPPNAQQPGPRNLIWDRARVRTDLARRKVEADRQAAELLRAHGHEHPRVLQARQRAEAITRQLKEHEAAAVAAGAPQIIMEKAAYLGVATSPATPVLQKHLKLPDGVGLVVDFIEPGSPAEAGGLKPFDVLVRVEQQLLVNPQQLAVLVRTFDPGAAVKFRIVREGEPAEVEVRLVEREVKPIGWVNFGDGANNAQRGGGGEAGRNANFAGPDARPDPLPAIEPAARVRDYVIRPGDLLTVRIHELQGPGLETVKTMRTAADGTIRLPYIEKPVRAAGLTETGLQKAILVGYRLDDRAQVSVTVVRAGEAPAGGGVPPPPQPVPPARRPAAGPQPVETPGPDE